MVFPTLSATTQQIRGSRKIMNFTITKRNIISLIISTILAVYLMLLDKAYHRFSLLNDDDIIRDDHHSPEALFSLFMDHNRRKQLRQQKRRRKQSTSSSSFNPFSILSSGMSSASQAADDDEDEEETFTTTELIDAFPQNPFLLLEMKKNHNRNDQYVKYQDELYEIDPEIARIYSAGIGWDTAPIVVEEYKLVFFTQGKVACTVFKQLLRRMMHLPDWHVQKEPILPHNPAKNGLKYLYHFPPKKALQIMSSPKWTRAIFVRDPKERLLSAYLDKVARKSGHYLYKHCCADEDFESHTSCGDEASKSLIDFMNVVQTYDGCDRDSHWSPQSQRVPSKFWPYINFVGRFDHLVDDTNLLLDKIGASWDEFGSDGWGPLGNESIFSEGTKAKHQTDAKSKSCEYYFGDNDGGNNNNNQQERRVTLLHDMVEKFYEEDYLHPMLNFNKTSLTAANCDID